MLDSLLLDLRSFLDQSPTPFHAVEEAAERLRRAGFQELQVEDSWHAWTKGFVRHAGGCLVAVRRGTVAPEEGGFLLIGAHTDSPQLRLKPHALKNQQGTQGLAVEPYGGGLWYSWLDRELGLAGSLIWRKAGRQLLLSRDPLCRLSSLAIHLNRGVNDDGLKLNLHQHLFPVWGLGDATTSMEELLRLIDPTSPAHHDDTVDFAQLSLFDVASATLQGPRREFLASGRLDNLLSCHQGLTALMEAPPHPHATQVLVLFDHEEVGSESSAGAMSRFLLSMLRRLLETDSEESWQRAAARSIFLSVDLAHGVHPAYADKHDPDHAPRLGGGPVLKVNHNQHYATDAPSAALLRRLADELSVPLTVFASRNDQRCGSTIGPATASRLGIRTCDLGVPIWGMHSCREVAAVADFLPMVRLLTHFYASAHVPPARW